MNAALGCESRTGARIAMFALLFLLGVSAAWWALALWPAGDAPPDWLTRARWVCFNAASDGLPDASGWMLLIGQPLGMLAVLMVVWGDQVRAGMRAAQRSRAGFAAVTACALLLAGGLVASGVRVIGVAAAGPAALDAALPDTYPRLDRTAPAISLVDQRGERLSVESLRGRPALVTFAFGNCTTVCPAIVEQVVAAQQRLKDRARDGQIDAAAVPRVVIVSLDPWRDTPSRLAHLGSHWNLDDDAYVVTGAVDEVEAVLDGWNVARDRDPDTGDLTHASLVYILDARGAIAFAARGDTATVLELLGRV